MQNVARKTIRMVMKIARTVALLLAVMAATSAMADASANNPVTGDAESYSYKYVGSASDSTWETLANWRNSDDSAYAAASGIAPNIASSNIWNPLLFDGDAFESGASKAVTATTIEGYTLNLGIFNGAQVTIGTLNKWQGGCKVRVDDNSSSLTISALGSSSYQHAVDYYIAGANGVTYSCAFNKGGNTHNYYLTGAGSVSYQAISAGTHVIKQADVALDGGTKARKSKTLVSFTSSSISFSADATIYVKDSGGTTKRTITATQITSSTPTITTDYPVGTCELVQESDGIKLYYIDGDYDADFVAYIGDDPTANKYHTIVEATAAIAEDNTLVKLTLLSSTEESFVVPSVGFVFDTNGKTVTGTISGASGVGLSEAAGVYTGIANTASTWTGSAGDGLWENAQNWSTKSVPTSATTVTFNDDTIVNLPYSSATANGVVIAEGKTLTIRRAGETPGTAWATFNVGGGGVSGNGTLKLVAAGIRKMVGQFTINANIVFENDGTHDSFLEENTSGTFTINGTVTGTGYLHIKTSTTFNGDVTIPKGSTIKVNSWTYDLGSGAGLYGAGTLKFDALEPSATMKTALQNKDKWTGVCEIYNKALTNINAANYGNVNSTVRYNKVTGYSAYWTNGTGEVGNVKCIDIGSEGLSFNNSFGSNSFGYTFAGALTGTGTITFGTSYGDSGTYTFTGDASAFAGTISFGSLAADKKAAVIFNSTGATVPTTGKGQIGIAAGTTVGLKEFTGTIVGSGTVKWTTLDPSSSVRPTFDPSWTGTVVLPSKQGSMTVNLAWWGVTGSRIKVMGFQGSSDGNSVKIGADAVAATVELAGNVRLQHGDDNTTYNIAALTGPGDFNTTLTGTPASTANMRLTYSFAKLTDYTGTISTVTPDAGAGKTWWTKVAIGTVNVSSLDLTSSAPVVKLGGTHDLVSIPVLTVNDVATSHELYQAADGNLYVKVASVTVGDAITYYPTIQAAADAAMAAGGETISFTRIDSDAVTSLPGWTYDDNAGTFTRTGYALNTTTGTEYATLAAAISASNEGDTIRLLYGNSEAAVDTTGKDFIFDENGYAFSGTWTGSGRIVLQTAPTTTTWAATSFVSSAENDDPTWTGTVTLDWENIVNAGELPTVLNKYGIAASFVEIGPNGTAIGYFSSTPTPKIRVSGSLTIHNGASGTKREISYVTGSGTIKVNSFISGTAETTNYKITTLDKWTGRFENYSSKMEITNIGAGTGVIYTEVAFSANPTSISSDWRGRVVFNYQNILSAGNFSEFGNKYGVVGSILEIGSNGTGTVHLGGNLNPDLIVNGDFTFNNGSSVSQRTINKVSGAGTLAFTSFLSGTAETTNYKVSNLADWTGTLTISSAKITIGTVADTVTGDVVIDYTNSAWTEKLSQYCGTNSRLIVRNLTGYLSDGDNSSNTGKIDAQTVEIGNVTIKDAWYLSSPNWTDGKTVKFAKMHLTGTLKMGKDGGTAWIYDNQRGCYMVDSLSVGEDGEIEVANQFAFRINAVEADGATPGQLVVPVTLSNAGDAKAVGELFGPDGNKLTAVNPIPVTVNGTANGQKLVYATIDANSGLYVAVASVVDGSTTSYYATLDDAKSNIGTGYIVPLKSGFAIELDDGETVRVDNSGTYQITVTAASGLMLGSSVGEDYTTYSAASATIMDGEDDVGTLLVNPFTGEITALVTKPAATVTIPAAASSVAVASAGNVISLTLAAGSPIAAASVAVHSTDASGAYSDQTSLDVTAAFAITVVPATATTAGSVTITLDATKSVSVWTGENDGNSNQIMKSVSVRPEVDTTVASPMAVDSNAMPVFTVNTIPGLWYAVKTSTTSGNDFAVESSTIYQAQYGRAATALPAATAPTTVKYYKIAVGASRAALQ